MTKQDFLDKLRSMLGSLSEEDIARSIEYYSEAIDDRIEEGMSEEEAVREMGSVEEAAKNILSVFPKGEHRRTQSDFAELHAECVQTVNERINSVRVDAEFSDVFLLASQNGICTVEYSDISGVSTNIYTENGMLVVRREGQGTRFGRLKLFFSRDDRVIIRIPAGMYDLLKIETKSGDIKTEDGFSLLRAELNSMSGDISIAAPTEQLITAHSKSGDVTVKNCGTAGIDAVSLSGDIRLISCEGTGDSFARSTSGDVEVTDCTCLELRAASTSGDVVIKKVECEQVNANSKSGDIEAQDVIASDCICLESICGDIRLRGCDGGTLKLKSTSGDINANLLKEKCVNASSVTGTVSVPRSYGSGECSARTVSGDIKITF